MECLSNLGTTSPPSELGPEYAHLKSDNSAWLENAIDVNRQRMMDALAIICDIFVCTQSRYRRPEEETNNLTCTNKLA